jgi:hypothetical protein
MEISSLFRLNQDGSSEKCDHINSHTIPCIKHAVHVTYILRSSFSVLDFESVRDASILRMSKSN